MKTDTEKSNAPALAVDVGSVLLNLHNDGKGNAQSFECWSEDAPHLVAGYGATPEEAKDKYLAVLWDAKKHIDRLVRYVESGQYAFIPVDCAGKPLSPNNKLSNSDRS